MEMENKRSIVFLTTGLNYGGAEIQLARLAVGLRERGWLVRVISMLAVDEVSPSAKLLERHSVPVVGLHMMRGRFDPRLITRITSLLREWQPDVLTTFMFYANVVGRVSGRLARVPVIVASIRSEKFGNRIRDLLERSTERLGDITVANSRLSADALVERGVIPYHRLVVIPNGIDLEKASVDASLRLHAETHEFLWLNVGRLEDAKDHACLLKAAEILRRSEPRFRLLIAGDGAKKSVLKDSIAQLNLGSNVELLGYRSDVHELLARCDAFVLSSRWEGLPNVVMEAMLGMRPVVATAVGGTAELVHDGQTGYLVPPRNPEKLAGAMARMMRHTNSERQKFGEAGRKHIKSNYGLTMIVGRWENLFLSLLEGKASGARQ